MATPKANSGDFTGRQRDKAIAEFQDEVERRNQEMAMATQIAAKNLETEVVDLSNPDVPVVMEEEDLDVQEETVELEEKTVVIRVNEAVKPTFAKVTYDLSEVGRKYRVPAHLAQHLEEKGLIWH